MNWQRVKENLGVRDARHWLLSPLGDEQLTGGCSAVHRPGCRRRREPPMGFCRASSAGRLTEGTNYYWYFLQSPRLIHELLLNYISYELLLVIVLLLLDHGL